MAVNALLDDNNRILVNNLNETIYWNPNGHDDDNLDTITLRVFDLLTKKLKY